MEPSVEEILALAPNWLGDAAMCTPALRALHQRYPSARLTVAGRSGVCQLLAGLPWLGETLELPERPGLRKLIQCARELRPHARDLAVVFPHSFRAALLARLAGARRRLGHARNGRSFLLTDRVPPFREGGRIQPVYMAEEYLSLLAPLGCEDDGRGLELHAEPALAEKLRHEVEDLLGGDGPLVGIAPGAAFGPSKRWSAERYGETARALHDRIGARCLLLTGPTEREIAQTVRAAAGIPLMQPLPSIAGLKAAIAQLNALICNDSGPRHIAVAFHIPTVCIIGSTSPVYSEGPYERGEVIREDVDCAPCQKPECSTDHRCMTRITTDRVVESAMRVLRTDGNTASSV